MKTQLMKLFLVLSLCLFLNALPAQNEETVTWINDHLIEIEDADPNSRLNIFHEKVPEQFKTAKIFGFGEATHHGKEFFDLKAKFFKYLVEHQGVRTFIMEENYPAESGINAWISGGEGEKATIAKNFTIAPWHNLEVVDLLEWMRNFNMGKPEEDQIRFYGMDIQVVSGIDKEIIQYVNEFHIPVEPELLAVVDSCVNKQVDYKHRSKWADLQLPKLDQLKLLIQASQPGNLREDLEKKDAVLRAIRFLKSYTYYIQHSKSVVRDQKMFEHVQWIIENHSKNGKAFIWAHNEHINNKEMLSYGSGWVNLGAHLKAYYKNEYYSVYFDFGGGELPGLVLSKNNPPYWDIYPMKKPLRKTYAETLIKAKRDIYFIDLGEALQSEANEFFSETKRQFILGASGYTSKAESRQRISKNYAESCDGLIFVKQISIPTYQMDDM